MTHLAMRIIATVLLGVSLLAQWVEPLEDDDFKLGGSKIFAIITIWII